MLEFKNPKYELLQIGQKFKEIRLALNMKRLTLALKSGVSESTIKRFESSGEISLPI
jgi:transcriptional regulator with XRE-family HTH domain